MSKPPSEKITGRRSKMDTLRSEYRLEDFPHGMVRGKFAHSAKQSNVVVIDPELSTAFPNSRAVNEALRAVFHAAEKMALPT